MIIYIKRQWRLLLVATCICLFSLLASMQVQIYKGKVIDGAISSAIQNNGYLFWILFFSIVIYLLFSYGYQLMRIRFCQACMKDLRYDFMKQLLSLPYRKFVNMDRGDLIAKYTKQMNQVESEYFTLIGVLAEMILRTIFVMITLWMILPSLTFVAVFLLSGPMIIPRLFEKRVKKAATLKMKGFEKHVSKVDSWLQNLEIIHQFQIGSIIQKKFLTSNDVYWQREYQYETKKAQGVGLSFIVSLLAQSCIMGWTGYFVYLGELSAGKFFTVLGLIGLLQIPLYWMATFYQTIITSKPVRDSLLEFIEQDRSYQWEKKEGHKPSQPVPITFEQVSFSYQQKPVLNQICMTFQPQQKYLLCGASGSGKTTSMNLLLGYDQPSHGQIWIGKRSVDQIEELSDWITIMRQDAVLFQDTLRHNLTLYQSVSDAKLIDMLEKVGLSSLATLDALDQMIDEQGKNLSGGEKKRICLARALLRKEPILIVDEPFANIDPQNIHIIEEVLLSIMDKTVIIISHQIPQDSSHRLDKIYHFEGGQVYAN